MKEKRKRGFTLIELSIALVIIGLIVGGILVGQDLISAAATRGQITQIERYNTAVNTFRGKYNYLPGDIRDPDASTFGFQPRGTNEGQGDGNGIIEGYVSSSCGGGSVPGLVGGNGEIAVFWQDLSTAGMSDVSIPVGTGYPSIGTTYSTTLTSNPSLSNWLPSAKIGNGNFLYVYSFNSTNYMGLSTVTRIGCALQSTVGANIPVRQAYNIDKKIDDGLPQSGRITACYLNYNVSVYNAIWSANGMTQGAGGGANCTPTTSATPGSSTTCFDNGNVAGNMQYSLAQNNGNGSNCALSFRFQ